ncbi:MAG TPA: hypothetical protein VK476_01460 [Flavobacterium sp.]|nr:hypothetical protein [Flavobacterium sp.]
MYERETTGIRILANLISEPDIKASAKLSNGETKLIVTTSNPRSNKLEFQIPNENWRSAEQLLREHHIAWEPAVDVGPG